MVHPRVARRPSNPRRIPIRAHRRPPFARRSNSYVGYQYQNPTCRSCLPIDMLRALCLCLCLCRYLRPASACKFMASASLHFAISTPHQISIPHTLPHPKKQKVHCTSRSLECDSFSESQDPEQLLGVPETVCFTVSWFRWGKGADWAVRAVTWCCGLGLQEAA